MGMRCDVTGYEDMKLSGALLKAVIKLGLYDGDCVFTLSVDDLPRVIMEMGRIIADQFISTVSNFQFGGEFPCPLFELDILKMRALMMHLSSPAAGTRKHLVFT